jgi:hypothetical protein
LPQLQGERALKTYREMSQNDPIIGASLLAISLLVRQVEWSVMPCVEDDPTADAYATWVQEALFTDVLGGWDHLLQEVLSMLWAGWSFHEVLYKRRLGFTADAWLRSRFRDGQWGWHSFPIRAQETLDHWLIDQATGQIMGMVQRDPVSGGLFEVPMEKAALFRPGAHKENPQGRSLLRNVYRPWYFSKRLEELQGIGIERDLAGLPVLYLPGALMEPTALPEDQAMYSEYKKIVTNVRRGQQEGVVLPMEYDVHGNQLYKFELLSSGGQRQIDITKVLEFYNKEKAIALLTDVLLLGHEKVGSFALADSKTTVLALAVGGLCGAIAEVFTEQIFPPLWALNGWPAEFLPHLQPGDVETVNLQELGDFLTKYAQAGLDVSDLENEVRQRAGFPLRDDLL